MHKVLLAVDGSAASDQAARFLAHLPHADQLELTIITVAQRLDIREGYLTAEVIDKHEELEKAFAIKNFQKTEAVFDGANVTTNHVIKDGGIGQSIVETAQEIEADLVVIGATGRSQISRILLGSISDHVATHAPCSVLVVRPTGLEEDDRAIRVCLAYDNNGPAQAALEEFAEIPWRIGSNLHVLTVAAYLQDFFGEFSSTDKAVMQRKADLQRAREQLTDAASNIETHLVGSEHVGEGIIRFADEQAIDLIVIGETHRSTLGRFLMGNTTRYVLRHASCSVWITRNRIVRGLAKTDAAQTGLASTPSDNATPSDRATASDKATAS